jgi:hypothetical protein
MAHRHDALTEHLRRVDAAKLTLPFTEVEAILRARLPDSARKEIRDLLLPLGVPARTERSSGSGSPSRYRGRRGW